MDGRREELRVDMRQMQRCFSSPENSDGLWNTPGLVFKEGSGASAQVKWPECKIDHTSPSSAYA